MTLKKQHNSDQRDAFIRAMRGVGASVCVVTTNGPAGRRGATVSAFCSVSADPPTVLVCLNAASQIATAVAENGCFNVNILHQDQRQIAKRFAGDDDATIVDRFDSIGCSAANVPEIDGAMVLCCQTQSIVPSTSHNIFIGHVHNVKNHSLSPLTYLNGDFHQLVPVDDEGN